MDRQTIPPMTAEAWRTMDESIFRQVLASNFTTIVSTEALRAIEARATSLGIETPWRDKARVKRAQEIMRGRWGAR